MISIFYVPCHQYVSSIHPLLFSCLAKSKVKNIQLININLVKSLDLIIEQSSLIVYDFSIIEAIRISLMGQKSSRFFLYFPHTESAKFYKNCTAKILESSKRKIFWASMNDAQNLFENIDQLTLVDIKRNYFLSKMEGIIWFFNTENLINNNQVMNQYTIGYENICKKINDTAEFVSGHFEYEFEIPHCVSINRKYYPVNKKWDFYIPGVMYPSREIALKSTVSYKLKNPNTKTITFLKNKYHGLIQKLNIIQPAKVYKINQQIMNYLIRYSKFSFVCGGPSKYLVRKFMEVPLQASVMVGYGPDNISDYGFIDRENYIYAEPELFGDVVNTFLNNKSYQEKLTATAYSTVSALHSVEIRAEQLVHSLMEINKQGAKKGKFIGGEYSFLDEHKKIIKAKKIAS